MLENSNKELLENNDFLNKRKNYSLWNKFKRCQKILFWVAIIICLFLLIFLYFCSEKSNIFYISIEGNEYYSDKLIRELAKVDTNNKYYLVRKNKIKNNLLNDPLFNDVTVEKLDGNIIKLTVQEKMILGYIYEDGLPLLLLEDDSRIEIDEKRLYLISVVPLIEGYSKKGLIEIEKGLKKVDHEVISRISEIHCFPFSYDEYMMQIIMDDGNYIFSSATDFKSLTLSYYYEAIYNLRSEEKICLYLNVTSKNITLQYRGCPWNE